MIYTTLNRIREHSPCEPSWKKLLKSLGKTNSDDESVSVEYILDTLGLDDALWSLRAVKGYDREIRLLGVRYARNLQHLMTDPRSLAALDVVERYANGEATDEELMNAWAAAGDAAWDAAGAAARAAAWDAAGAAARDAAWDAAWAAAGAAARDAAWAAAGAAARDAALKLQESQLRAMLEDAK